MRDDTSVFDRGWANARFQSRGEVVADSTRTSAVKVGNVKLVSHLTRAKNPLKELEGTDCRGEIMI